MGPQKYKNETQNSGYPDFVHPWHEKWNKIELTHYPISPHIRGGTLCRKTDPVCSKASCRNFPPHKAWLPLYTPTSNNNVMLDDSITSVGDYLSRELYTRAPGSREYPLHFVPNRQNPEKFRYKCVSISACRKKAVQY